MRQKKPAIRRQSTAALLIYLTWLFFTIAMWNTKWMAENKVVTGVSLVFAGIIYVLLCFIRRLPQLHMTRRELTQAQSFSVIRLRLWLVASLKFIFVCGFCGMSVSLLFSETIRILLAVLFMVSILSAFVLFWIQYRKIVPPKKVKIPK